MKPKETWDKIFQTPKACRWYLDQDAPYGPVCLLQPHEDTIIAYRCSGVCRNFEPKDPKRSIWESIR